MSRLIARSLALLYLASASVVLAQPGAFRATLPSPVRGFVEERVELEGTLEVLIEDYADGRSREVIFLETDSGDRYALSFASDAPRLPTGTRVKVTGLRVGQAIAVESAANDIHRLSAESLESIPPNTFGAQKTAVFVIAFQDQPTVTSTSVAAARDTVFNASNSVSNFFLESSYQQTWLTGDVFGPYTVPYNTNAGCPYTGIGQAAEAAARRDGVKLQSYKRRVYAFPFSFGCHWSGVGTVRGNQAWINGGSAALNGLHPSTVAHELGHNFGLNHSHALDCGSVTIGGTCTSVEYGDTLDTMGSGAWPSSHFNADQKERIGWLNYGASPPITTVTATGTYSIDPLEPVGSNPKALKIPVPGGDTFFVEYRQQVADNPNVSNGVVIHFDDGTSNGISLLDMTPETSSWYDPALTVGRTFTDPASGITIRTNSAGSPGASVTVTLAGGSGVSFSDDFNRVDSTDLGGAWSEVSGNLILSGNKLKNAPGAGNHVAVVSALSGATQEAEADFTSVSNNLGPRFGIVLRYQGSGSYYLIFRQVGGASRFAISRFDNGVETILATSPASNPATNVSFRLKGRVTGTTLSLDVNGVNKVNVTDAAFGTGQVGILLGSTSATVQHQADNFAASAQ